MNGSALTGGRRPASGIVLLTLLLLAARAALAQAPVLAWGDNTLLPNNVPPGLGPVVQVVGGFDHTLARLPNGTLVAWGGR